VPEGSKWELVEGFAEMGSRPNEAFPVLLGQLALKGTPSEPSGFTLHTISNALIKINPEAAAEAGVRPSTAQQP
jgi:hypothetical protein